jgi:hypothetical protein
VGDQGLDRRSQDVDPTALQLRHLQTPLELGASQSRTIVFPAPIDMIKPFIENFSTPRGITPTSETERRQAA